MQRVKGREKKKRREKSLPLGTAKTLFSEAQHSPLLQIDRHGAGSTVLTGSLASSKIRAVANVEQHGRRGCLEQLARVGAGAGGPVAFIVRLEIVGAQRGVQLKYHSTCNNIEMDSLKVFKLASGSGFNRPIISPQRPFQCSAYTSSYSMTEI